MPAEELWRAWIIQIANDPEMDVDRILRHLQDHVGLHMPDEDAPQNRWEAWIAGTYNLLAILGCMKGIDPEHKVGINLLLKKWSENPINYTPPPTTVEKYESDERGWNS